MFCQNCGTKNEDDAIFCEACGTKLEREEQEAFVYKPLSETKSNNASAGFGNQPVGKNFDVKSMDRTTLFCIVEAIVLVIAAIAFFQTGKKMTSPEHVAEQYFVSEMACDADGIYDTLNFDESSEFLTKKALEEALSSETPEKYKNYEVSDKITSGVTSVVEIAYVDANGDADSKEITLTKTGNKRFFLFDDWKVTGGDLITPYFYIYVPKGAEVKFDDVELSDAYLSESDVSTMDTYMIENIFTGMHKVTMSIGDLSGVEQSVYASPYTDEEFFFSKLQLDEETQEILVNKTYQNMLKLMNAAYTNASFSTLSDLYVKDSSLNKYAKNTYESLCDDFYREGESYASGITALAIKDVSGKVDSVYVSEGVVMADINLEFTYDVSYISYGFISDTAGTSEEEESLYVTLNYEDGKWLLGSEGIPSYLYY